MIFILITFLAAFLIEGLGTAVSVIGLSTLFGANPIIIALAISLDIGKLVVVSLLYNHWKRMGMVMKSYALLASVVTMVITSAGAAGYLTGEFQKAILGTQETMLKVNVLKDQQAKYEERKKQIDNQIANLPEKTTVNQRIRLMKQFQDEQKSLQTKIEEIDKQLPELQLKQIGVEAKAGPILYISKAFNVPVEVAVKYVVMLIIFVFDPLAVFLMIAGNFLLEQRKKKPTEPKDPDPESSNKVEELPEMVPEINEMTHSAHMPDEPTFGAMKETDDIIERRYADDFMPRGKPEESFVPGVVADEARDFDRKREPLKPIAIEESIAKPESSEQATPDEAVGPSFEQPVPPPTEKPRKEITLFDLKPHRSVLNDVKPDDGVQFEANPRSSTTQSIYKN